MVRARLLFFFILFVAAAFGLFQLKYSVQELTKEIVELERELEAEKEAVHVLEAEWTYLNQPDRLKKLSNRYIAGLDTVSISQTRTLQKNSYALNDAVMTEINLAETGQKDEGNLHHKVKWNYRKTKDNGVIKVNARD